MLAKHLIRKAPKFLGDVVAGRRPISDAKRIIEYQRTRRKNLINLEITSRCNTSCTCCMRDPKVLGISTNLMMSTENVAQVLDAYDPEETQAVLLGGSESLLHPEFFTILKMVEQRFPLQKVDLYTNGILLSKDREMLDRLTDSGIGSVTFSLQGARQDTVSRLQPGVSIEGVLAAAERLHSNSVTGLVVSYVVQEANLHEMLDFVDLIGNSAFNGISFIPFNRADFIDTPYDYVPEWERQDLWKRLEEANAKAARYGLQITHVSDLCSCGLDMDIIRANGAVQLCPGNSKSEYLVGNVFEDGVAAVRERKKRELKKITRALRGRSVPTMCAACSIRNHHLLP